MQVKPRLEAVPELEDRHILWARPTIRAVTGMADTAIYAAIHRNDFPLPLKIGRKSMWRKSDVLAWIDSRNQELDVLPTKKGN